MAWIELHYQTTKTIAEELSHLLETQGALAVTLQDAADQPLYEPPINELSIWDDVIVVGLFDTKVNIDEIIQTIAIDLPQLTPQIKHIVDQDWERIWMADFQAMQFGDRLRIIPSFQAQQLHENEIILDPGLAFGTGKHATTALCLEWLDRHIVNQTLVIDYGCGSGILGIAALKLGAQKVFAVDHDPQALIATVDNAKRNQLDDGITTFLPEELPKNIEADLLLANILANPLIELAPLFASLVKPGGNLVLSGILVEQKNLILDAYNPWFTIIEVTQKEEWLRIDGIRQL